jgi:hypothetical protein
MFEGDSADACANKFPLRLMGGRAGGLACTDPGGRTPIGASGYFLILPTLLRMSSPVFCILIFHKMVKQKAKPYAICQALTIGCAQLSTYNNSGLASLASHVVIHIVVFIM